MRKAEPTPLPPKAAPETPLYDPNIYKSVVHRTQKHTPKTLIPGNQEHPRFYFDIPTYMTQTEGKP